MANIKCMRFREHKQGALVGFADLHIVDWGMQIYGCTVFSGDKGRRWVNLPSKEYKGEDGKTAYSSIIRFEKKEVLEAFSKAALNAIDAFNVAAPEEKKEAQQADLPF